MAKKALLDVLEQTIGKYVKNLDAESLNVAVWSGKIELHDLLLDCDSVNAELSRQAAEAPNLAVPFRVTAGQFNSFQVHVPWSKLMSSPVILRAKGLQIEVEPYNRTANADFLFAVAESEAARTRKIQQARVQNIHAADDYRKRSNALRKLAEQDLEADSTGKQSASANPNASFGARLVRRILENIQVEISDVHVSLKGSDCKAGVLLDKLQLMTTDKNGKQIFVDRTAAKGGLENSFLYKALQIQGLGVYLDESETRHVRLGSIQEEPTTVLPHSYVLAPLSFEAKLRQADSNLCIEYPKYLLASELSSLSILLSKTQLDLGNKITEAIKPSDKVARPLFPEYRPLGRVSTGTAKDWWKYALRCVGRLNGRRSWAEFFAAFQERKMYIPLYKRHAHHASCSWLKRLNPEELAVLEGVERNRTISVEGLMTWRNIADAQVEKEQEKYDAKRAAEKGSLFTSLFGSSQKKTGAATEEEAPISLSVQEMKELEALTHEQVVDAELSNDSRLCDVKFVLGSLRVNLTSYDLRPVADLQMGTVSTAFDANADGSFGFDLSLASLEITDMVTPKSYFPTVLKNQELPESSDAFSVRIAKAKSGDQQLDVKLSTFEAVASPLLLLELKRLFTLLPQPLSQKSSAQNPMLAQSMSGSVDLFYDANELASSQMTIVTTPMNEPAPLSAPGGSDISGTLIDAWKTKTETQTSWTIDLDIQAPIIVVPENCIEPRANVLVFDLGHLKLLYGKIETAPKVKEWFRINPRHLSDKEDPVLDNALLNITSLTFSIGRVNYGRRLVQKHETSNPTIEGSEDALINPISLSINLGVESRVKEDVPRVCTFGVLPSISLSISPSQLSRVLLISKAWMKVLKDISPPSPEAPHAEDSRADDDMSTSSAPDKIAQFVEQARRLAILPSDQQQQHAFARFHVDMRLQRISLKIWTGDTENGMEAHLISVFASVSSLSDGSTSSQLSMGWFWILDRFDTPSPRRQRLLAHSRLPLSPVALAEDEKYDILGELQRVGAFDENFAGSTDLADIKFRQSAGSSFGAVDPFTSDTLLGDEFNVESILDAKFTSLYVNLNPHGLKTITEMAGKFGEFLGNTMQAEAGSLIVTSPTGMQPRRRSSIGKASKGEEVNAVTSSMSVTLIRATLDNFEVSLNSARDDLPLFVLAMSRTELSLVSSSDQNMKLSLDLGDLSVSTPAIGRTDPQYRTILGLAPGRSKSLLSVLYCVGSRAMETLDLDGLDLKEYEACAEVELSPMRMVYIQAQVLALVEYATEGILGVLATQAASSAAAAAVEIATSIGAKKFFCVKATGFEVVLPQAAYRSKHISVSTGAMQVGYVAMPEPGGGEANITLSDVALADDTGSQMQEEPTMMSIKVILPPDTVGTDEDKAMRVTIDISKASFLLTKWQYAQVLATLDMNIGEADLCLREKLEGSLHNQAPGESDTPSALTGQTHAGVAFVDNPRRLYLDVRIIALSVELCGDTDSEPIVRVGAVDTSIWYKNLPDQKKMTFQVSMLDLICDDRRLKSSGRQYRSLIYQKDPMASGTVEEDAQNLFFVSYEASENGSSSVDVNIGSPRLVLIPDAMSEVLAFLDTPRESKGEEETTPQATKAEIHDGREVIQVDAHETDNTVEVAFVPENEAVDSAAISSVSISLKTGQCSIILVDLGSDSVLLTKNSTATVSSVAETIVLSGTFNAKVTLGRNPHSGEVVDTNAEMHGDKLEAYTAFGRKLSSPLQILDPVDLSIYFSLKVTNGNGTSTRNVDLRAAALTPLDISLSMRNVALVNAIVSSVSECIDDESTNQASDRERFLSEKETARIQKLASALDREGTDPSVHSRQSSCVTEISAPGTVDQDDAKNPRSIVSVKITMPETKLMLINDLQGLDEALLRINVRNLVVGGQSRDCERFARSAAAPFTAFDFNLHTSILADYFDISSNDWEVLLLEPWELSLKAGRIANKRVSSPRPSTTIDMESFPCHLSFSEQFLMSLASANRMWSVYSSATSTAVNSVAQALDGAGLSGTMRRSMAATAARTFISSLPYAVDNSSGVSIRFQVHGEHEDSRTCENGSIEYFRFEPPPAKGSGGKRLYGRDVTFLKSLSVFVGESVIELKDLDRALGSPFRAHELGNGQVLMSRVAKEGKTIVLHVSSGMNMRNQTSVPFAVSVLEKNEESKIGVCTGSSSQNQHSKLVAGDDSISRASRSLGVPVQFVDTLRAGSKIVDEATLSLFLTPSISGVPDDLELRGRLDVKLDRSTLSRAKGGTILERQDVTCRPTFRNTGLDSAIPGGIDAFILQASIVAVLVDGKHAAIDIFLEPRAILENKMPVTMTLSSPMPHTFSSSSRERAIDGENVHELQPNGCMEIFTPGPSIAIKTKCTDKPIGGTSTDWMEGGWIDLPLVSDFSLPEPLRCFLPFSRKIDDPLALAGSRGSEFFIAEGNGILSELSLECSASSAQGRGQLSMESSGIEVAAPSLSPDHVRTFYVTVCNYAVDHTGGILFEQLHASTGAQLRRSSTDIGTDRRQSGQVSAPFGAYGSRRHHGRISLLPNSNVPIRLLHLTMDGDEGIRRSAPFPIEEISICEGGVESTPLHWEDGATSGYFAYRKLVNSYQSEVHVVPEYVVFNGSDQYQVRVRLPGGTDMIIEPGQVAPLRTQGEETAIITVDYLELGARTAPLRVDALGLRVSILKSADGFPVGSLAVQTVVGAQDSRLVIKLGEIKFGSSAALEEDPSKASSMFKNDYVRFRVQWSELRLSLKEARPITDHNQAILESALDRIKKAGSPTKSEQPSPLRSPFRNETSQESETWVDMGKKVSDLGRETSEDEGKSGQDESMSICTIILRRFTIDWQRVFKEEEHSEQMSAIEALSSPERSQLSVIVHNVRMTDDSPGSLFPIVFDSSSEVSFFDLCIRCRGSLSSELVKIDLFDLNLAHANGISHHIVVNTSEDFVWKILDLGDRILVAAGEFAGIDIELEWDEEHDGYTVSIRDRKSSYIEEERKYAPPKSDQLYAINKVRVSPFNMVASFRRNPQSSRYKLQKGVRGANLMNYFTRRLKFKIDKAELKFSRYEASNIKGPADRLTEILTTVYLSRMKLKMVTIMTAASFQDWKFLAARDGGDDDFVEGDLLRVTGNLAGNTANYVFKKAGSGVGKGVSNMTHSLGDGIEDATAAIGARHLGAGFNSVFSGVGDGVGSTLTGVGSGAGQVFKGAGQGVGHIFGGVSGGAMMMGKGVGKGITTGDGKAVISGITQGVASVGTGVGQGVESVVTGAAEGVFSVGKGLFSGVKSVGRGIGGAFADCGCHCFSCCMGTEGEEPARENALSSPLLPNGPNIV